MDKTTLKKIIEAQIAVLKGDAFQDMCDNLCLKLYPNDYTPVRAGGPKGDAKNDGYCPEARIYFAAHATRGEKIPATKKKIKSDLEGCIKKHRDVQSWIYLTNDTLVGEIQQFVDNELRSKYTQLTIETWDHKRITEKMLTFKESDIGLILELDIGVTVHLEAEIENAARLLNNDKPQEALVLLDRLWEQHSHAMTGHQKYRTRANIGHAYDRLGQPQKAAECFLEAKQYDPENEKAKAREALAYLYYGNHKKAFQLADLFLKEYPENTLGISVLVISAPNEMSFDQIEQLVPEHHRNDIDVAMALGEAAIYRDHYDIAEKYISCAFKEKPDNPQIKEKLGDLLLKRARITEQTINDRGPTKEEAKYLEQAKILFSEAIDTYSKQNLVGNVVRIRLLRAMVYSGLHDAKAKREDILFAYNLTQSEFEAVFQYAEIKRCEGDVDGAIQLLETLLGKDLRCTVELALSQCLRDRNAEGDKKRAIELLRGRLYNIENEVPELRMSYISVLINLEYHVEGPETAFQRLETLPKNIISEEFSMVLRGELFKLMGDPQSALTVAEELSRKMKLDINTQDKRQIATFFQITGMHKKALALWKSIVKPEYIGGDTYCLMECADRCEDINFIIEFAEKLRANNLWERKLFELELNYREKYNDDKGAREIMEKYLKNPADLSYVPYIKVRLSLLGIRTGQKNLIEKVPTKLPSVKEVDAHTGRAVATILRHGPNPIMGVDYAYELIRLNWDQRDAHMAMMESIFAPIGPAVHINQPDIVAPGVAVQYQENDTQVLHWHIIEDSEISKPESARNEFPTEHQYSQEMLGKKSSEIIYLTKGGFQERTATIKRMVSKYVYRFNDCLEGFEKRFSGQTCIRRIIIKDEGGVPDLSPIDKLIENDAERVQKIEDLYANNLVPINMVANLKGRCVLEAMQHVIYTPTLKFKCCKGTDEEEEIAERTLQESENIVLDATALSTIFLLREYELLSKIPNQLYVSEGTIDEFREILKIYNNPESMAGTYTKNGFIPWNPKDIKEMCKDIQELVGQIQKCCKVESGLIIGGIENTRRSNLMQIFGQSGIESLMLSAKTGYPIWTDDLGTAEVGRIEFQCRRVWTQKIICHFCEKGLFPTDYGDEVTVKLMYMKYYYTKPTVGSFLKAAEKTQGDVDKNPLLQVLGWFSDPNVKIEGISYIGAMFIKNLWQSKHLESVNQAITIRLLEQLAKIPKGQNVIMAWLNNIHIIFGIDIINATKVKQVIESWLNGGQRRRIIIP